MSSGYLEMWPQWHKLPIELKEMVLEYRLRVDNAITWRTNPSHSRRALLPLLLTSKEMNDMAAKIWAEKNSFRLLYSSADRKLYSGSFRDSITSRRIDDTDYSSHLRYPGLNIADMIRKLELQLTIMNFDWSRHFFAVGDERWGMINSWYLLINRREPQTNPGAAATARKTKVNDLDWQVTLPNLVDLRIEIVMRPDHRWPNRTADCQHGHVNFDRFFRDAYIRLRAKKVVVAVGGIECGDYETGKSASGKTCPFKCAMKLGTGVENLIELKH